MAKMNALTQEDVFRDAESGGFTVGYKLPDDEGTLDNLKIIRIEAKKGDDPIRLVNRVIEAFGCKPLRGLLQRGEQLSQLIGSYTDQGIGLIVVIESAHLLNRRTIYSLKLVREHTTQPFPPAHVGFVLLGNPETIQATVNVDEGLVQRAARLPTLIKLVGS